jgi:isocitrate/isopropylmalate dehydrogenase
MSTRICVFPGDGAATTAVHASITVLKELPVELTFDIITGTDNKEVLSDGCLPKAFREAAEHADCVLFGATEDLHVPVLKYLRYEYGGGMVANLRPVRYIEGVETRLTEPEDVDYVIIRENLEGLYARAEGALPNVATHLPEIEEATGQQLQTLGSGAYALRIASERRLQEFAETACNLAEAQFPDRQTIRFTYASKSNVLPETDGLFDELLASAASSRDRLEGEHLHADDVANRIITDPERFDVIVTPNFAGDLLSDAAAGTIGGLGIAPSGCYNSEAAYFEPVHGAAPDIAGQNIINPTATLLSAAMLLDYEEHQPAANQLRSAIGRVYQRGQPLTPDQGGNASTAVFAAAVADHL